MRQVFFLLALLLTVGALRQTAQAQGATPECYANLQ
jgi:hypothetical protein